MKKNKRIWGGMRTERKEDTKDLLKEEKEKNRKKKSQEERMRGRGQRKLVKNIFVANFDV